MVAAASRYQAQGVRFIGIAFNDTQREGTAFLRQYQVPFPSGPDASGQAYINYGVAGIPETVFIDARGVIVSKYGGPFDARTLDQSIAQILR